MEAYSVCAVESGTGGVNWYLTIVSKASSVITRLFAKQLPRALAASVK